MRQNVILFTLSLLCAGILVSCHTRSDDQLNVQKDSHLRSQDVSSFEAFFEEIADEGAADELAPRIASSDIDSTMKEFLLTLSKSCETERLFGEFFLELADGGNENLESRIVSSSLDKNAQEVLIALMSTHRTKTTILRGADGSDYTDFLTPEQKAARRREILAASAKAMKIIFKEGDPSKAVQEAQKDLQRIHDKYTDLAKKNGWKGN